MNFIERAKLRMQKYLLIIAMFGVFTLLVAPTVQYGYEFGIEGWQQYQNWIVMSSHLSGVYSLIIALLAFLFLVAKVTLRFKQKQSDYDQAFIRDCKQDLGFYQTELEHYLDQWVDDSCTHRDMLHAHCGVLSGKKPASKKVKEQLTEFAINHPKLLGIWHPPVIILDTLNKPNRYPYKHNHLSCVAKAAGILSLQTSAALDKLAFVISTESDRKSVYFWEKSKTFSARFF